jgi:uncharacterized protein YukE
MSNVSYDYDTAAIRREAHKILQCRNYLVSDAMPCVKNVRARLDGNFEGQAADALEESLGKEQARLRTLGDDLSGLYSALMRFADALERADQQVADLMK